MHLLEYVLLLHPQTGTYSLVQAISFLDFSVSHPLSFEIQPTVNSNVKTSNSIAAPIIVKAFFFGHLYKDRNNQ